MINRSSSSAMEKMQGQPPVRPRIIANHYHQHHHQAKKFGRSEGMSICSTTSASIMNPNNVSALTSPEVAEIETVL